MFFDEESVGAVIPEFSFCRLNTIHSLHFDTSADEDRRMEVSMRVQCFGKDKDYQILFRLYDVRLVKIIDPLSMYLDEPYIEDVSSRQMEGILYEFNDYQGSGMNFQCGDIQVLKIWEMTKRDPVVIWESSLQED